MGRRHLWFEKYGTRIGTGGFSQVFADDFHGQKALVIDQY